MVKVPLKALFFIGRPGLSIGEMIALDIHPQLTMDYMDDPNLRDEAVRYMMSLDPKPEPVKKYLTENGLL